VASRKNVVKEIKVQFSCFNSVVNLSIFLSIYYLSYGYRESFLIVWPSDPITYFLSDPDKLQSVVLGKLGMMLSCLGYIIIYFKSSPLSISSL